jgi:hypothetical protein
MYKTKLFILLQLAARILFVGFAVTLAACNKTTTTVQLISNNICNLPCWQSIVTGKSSTEEVIGLLNNNENIDQKSIYLIEKPWNIFDEQVKFTFQEKNLSGEIYFIDDEAVLISLFGDMGLNFSKAIEILGLPKYIITIPTYSGPPGSMNMNFQIFSLIPNDGIEFSYSTSDHGLKSKTELLPENNISRISFFDPNMYNNLLDAGIFSEGLLNSLETTKYLVPWSGYGEIDQKYPPAVVP